MNDLVPLGPADLPVPAAQSAPALLGLILVRETSEGLIAGRIVETEAYEPGDAASHAFRGPTPRNRTMFGPPGHAYVYFTYGMHFALNVTAEPEGLGGGVLLRAIAPLRGIEVMRARRGPVPDRDLARGPGRLAQALGIDRTLDGVPLLAGPGPLWLARGSPPDAIGVSTRIGITKAAERRLRFFVPGDPFVSGPGKLNRWPHNEAVASSQ